MCSYRQTRERQGMREGDETVQLEDVSVTVLMWFLSSDVGMRGSLKGDSEPLRWEGRLG